MKLERQQILSLYMKVMKKFYKYLSVIESKETHSTVSRLKDVSELKNIALWTNSLPPPNIFFS